MKDLIDWTNRIGIILNFLSFWFVAPEITGEERLKRWERRLERGIRTVMPPAMRMVISFFITAVFGLVPYFFILSIFGYNDWPDLQVSIILITIFLVFATIAVTTIEDFFRAIIQRTNLWSPVWRIVFLLIYIVLIISPALYSVFTSPEQDIIPLYGLFMMLIAVLFSVIFKEKIIEGGTKKIVEPLLKKLANDKYIRQRSLALGIVMFIVGNILQFIATF